VTRRSKWVCTSGFRGLLIASMEGYCARVVSTPPVYFDPISSST